MQPCPWFYTIIIFVRCLEKICYCSPPTISNLINECANKIEHDINEAEINKEPILFKPDDLVEEGEEDYDTEEDFIEEKLRAMQNEDDNNLTTSPNVTVTIPSDNSTPFGTPPSRPEYVGSLPNELEVGELSVI